jgi:soluble lytic murein transglycosylase-like protein
MKSIILAICFLIPNLGPTTTKKYAKIIEREGRRFHIDPLLIVTIIHVETARTWKRTVRSSTADWGLMQVHVSTTTNAGLIGREEVLFDPALNIRYGTAILAMWRSYHSRTCHLQSHSHPFWAHYQFGYRIRKLRWSRKVAHVYRLLVEKFDGNKDHKDRQYAMPNLWAGVVPPQVQQGVASGKSREAQATNATLLRTSSTEDQE